MVSRVRTVAFEGLEARDVDVEVQITNGLPAFTIVGLADKAVAESKERVRGALHALGLSLPPKRLTVNMAPADLAKEGSHYDLPIALAVLGAIDVLPREELSSYLVLGELSLDSSVRAVAGVLPAALHAQLENLSLVCPAACGSEAAWAGDLSILAPQNLLQLINHFKGTQVMSRPEAKLKAAQPFRGPDFSDIKGQESAKRVMEIAAAGGHNVLMTGPPGAGKSLLASALPGILPPLSAQEALEVSMIHSLAGMLPEDGLMSVRPYRDPHHSASQPALVGGGAKAKPGEISLAHHGVLFLDELPEFDRSTLESLRQPIETGETLIARANHHARYPAQFQLIAAMNPCRCGYLGDAARACSKAPRCGTDYQLKLSGPLLDRIDLQIDVPAVSIADLNTASGDTSNVVRQRVIQARYFQQTRAEYFKDLNEQNVRINARIPAALVDKTCLLSDKARSTLMSAAQKWDISARSYHRLIKVARTIADLDDGPEIVEPAHIAEALSYRRLLAVDAA